MLNTIANFAALLRAVTADRARLAMENAVLRQQLNVLMRSAKRPQLEDEDRIFWMLVRQLFSDWAEHLVIVKPEAVIRWHRRTASPTTGVSDREGGLADRRFR